MKEEAFEKMMDSLDANLRKISKSCENKGATEISLGMVVSLKCGDDSYRSATVRIGSPVAIKGAMYEYLNVGEL